MIPARYLGQVLSITLRRRWMRSLGCDELPVRSISQKGQQSLEGVLKQIRCRAAAAVHTGV